MPVPPNRVPPSAPRTYRIRAQKNVYVNVKFFTEKAYTIRNVGRTLNHQVNISGLMTPYKRNRPMDEKQIEALEKLIKAEEAVDKKLKAKKAPKTKLDAMAAKLSKETKNDPDK